jgi:hypothetical protein
MLCDSKLQDAAHQVIYIDKEKREFDAIRTYQDLNEYIGSLTKVRGLIYATDFYG